MGQMEGLLKGFMQKGYSILSYDYPMRSLDDSVAIEQRLYKAGLAASLYAQKVLNIPVRNQVIMGNSLGSIVSAKVNIALQTLGEQPKALIMVSSFPNAKEAFVQWRNRWGIFARFLSPDKISVQLDARSALRQNKHVPVLFLQGAKDQSTPYEMAEEMKTCIPLENTALKKVVPLPHCKHKLSDADYPTIVKESDVFLEALRR